MGAALELVEFTEAGGISPLPNRDVAVNVELAVVNTAIPGAVVTSGGAVELEFAEAGGMAPELPTEMKVAVELAVERISTPDEILTKGGNPETELAGGMTPVKPVELVTAVELPMEMISIPEEVVTVMFNTGVSTGMALLEILTIGGGIMVDELVLKTADEEGGMTPSEPVEVAVAVLLATVRFTLPSETVSTTVTTPPVGGN